MNLVSMLYMSVTPLSQRPEPAEPVKKKQVHRKDTDAANIAKHRQSMERYRNAMGNEWVQTQTIESRLGYARASCLDWLNTQYLAGTLSRRKAGGEANWNKRKGYEWKFKQATPPTDGFCHPCKEK